MADLSAITDLVQWAESQENPTAAMAELTALDRAFNPTWYAEMDHLYADVDMPPEED